MSEQILVATAYLPPVEYFSHISGADVVLIEREENYIKQSYRNRCYILSAHGPQSLSVPVLLGSVHKTPVKDIRIDYTKRWQQIHIRAIRSSYGCSPFFQYYFEDFEGIICKSHNYLIDLNLNLLEMLIKILKLKKKVLYTDKFLPAGIDQNDFRYSISPKKNSDYIQKEYQQVFGEGNNFVTGLSIIDLIFNMGPDSGKYLQSSLFRNSPGEVAAKK